MYSKKDRTEPEAAAGTEPPDELQEQSLSWLLDMDLSEPEERLFALTGNEYIDEGLSAHEAEVAARPLSRGNASGDDLSLFVEEEIVISSDSQSGIYSGQHASSAAVQDGVARRSGRTGMAVDFSRRRSDGAEPSISVADGSDILGLADDDDIGETFLTIRRVRNTAAVPAAPAAPPEETVSDVAAQGRQAIGDDWDAEAWLGQPAAPPEETVSDAGVQGRSAATDGWDSDAWLGQPEGGRGADSCGAGDATSAAPADTISLCEAPVPRLVAAPGDHAVANDDPREEDALDTCAASATPPPDAAHRNVLEYVAQRQPPLDDDEFDAYLLGGKHLDDGGADLDVMTVERTEGIVSVDPCTEVVIDYHEDFRALEGFERSSVSVIAATIGQLVAELAARAGERVRALQGAADFVDVSVMLGIDPDSVKQCYADGYEPIVAVCPELPRALQDLAPAERETIYVRLSVGQAQEPRNDLFRAAAGEESRPAPVDVSDAVSAGVHAAAALDCNAAPPDGGWCDELDGSALFESSDTLEEVFDELSIEGDLTREQQAPEPRVDDLSLQQLPAAAPLAAPHKTLQEALHESPQNDLQETQATAPEQPTVLAVDNPGFDEDIFAGDFEAELLAGTGVAADDIDAAFAGLSSAAPDSDAICGVDLDEFADTDTDPQIDTFTDTDTHTDTHTDTGAGPVAESIAAHAPETPAGASSGAAWWLPDGIAFNHTSQSGTGIFADFLDAFIEEGAAEVEKLENAIGTWERDVRADSAFVPVARILHTLKGIAKGVGLQFYGTLIHNFETLLEGMPRPEPEGEQQYFRIVNAWLDATVQGLETVRQRRADIGSEFPVSQDATARGVADLPAAARDAAPDPAAAADRSAHAQGVAQRAVARQKKRDQQLADEGAKALAAQQSVRITSEKLDQLLNLTNQAQQLGVRAAQSTSRSKRAAGELHGRLTSVRSHIAKIADRALLNVTARSGQTSSELDALEMDQYSELQEAANILREAVEDLSDLVDLSSRHNSQVEALLKQQSSVVATIGSSIQAARVVPVSRLMPGLRRIVRTVGADLDKSVSFHVLNEVGALDRDHYARCQIILEHMVRNALDHGIESPEERLAAGKATTGRITVDVRKAGADYVVTLSDDGRGIDPDALRESAYDKGLDIDVDALSDEEALHLIFHKGFSTARSLSEVSGRGVGMDIVLSELQQLGGDIRIQSELGHGTSFELRIPSNVSVNGALFVTAGASSYAIPLNGLVAIEHVPADEFFAAVENGGTLQLFDLTCEPGYLGTLCHGDSLPDRDTWGSSVPVIIAGSPSRHMAIAIDDVEEALELVVRSLGPQFAAVPGLAGAATTSGGEAIVALDLNVLVESVVAGDISAVAVDHARDNTLLALVVDDSRTQRMVATSQFDTVGVETITAENGLVAIDLLNTTHRLPDVILLDVEMPLKDGIETLREIRKSRRYSHLPVIMVTSRTGAKHRALAQQAGCNGYMGKPFNFPLLIEQINELTGHNLQLS